MHDDVAAAEDRDGQQNINDRISQRFSVNQKKFEVRLEAASTPYPAA
jgi:hypothetical protein